MDIAYFRWGAAVPKPLVFDPPSEPLDNEIPNPLRDELVQKFCPILVLHPEYEPAASSGEATVSGDGDYAPRDIRFVLSMAEAQALFRFAKGIPAALMRQFPLAMLFLGVAGICGWVYLLFILSRSGDTIKPFVAVALFATLWFAYSWGLGLATNCLRLASATSNKQRLVVVGISLAFMGYGVAQDGWLDKLPFVAIGGVVLFISFAGKLGGKRNSIDLLNQFPLADDQHYLGYRHAGSVDDADGHQHAYQLALKDPAANSYPATVYGRAVRGRGPEATYVAIQYWVAYFYNKWRNVHEMDWEQVTVYVQLPGELASTANPLACGFSVHQGGIISRWKTLDRFGSHPIVYVAKGSHANYPRPGRHLTWFAFGGLRFTGKEWSMVKGGPLTDYLDNAAGFEHGNIVKPRAITLPMQGKGYRTWEKLHACGDRQHELDSYGACVRDFRWLNLWGHWGWPGGAIGGSASPVSPQMQLSWDPFAWLYTCEELLESTGSNMLREGSSRLLRPIA